MTKGVQYLDKAPSLASGWELGGVLKSDSTVPGAYHAVLRRDGEHHLLPEINLKKAFDPDILSGRVVHVDAKPVTGGHPAQHSVALTVEEVDQVLDYIDRTVLGRKASHPAPAAATGVS